MNNLKYEDLEVYQLAEKLSDRIWEIVVRWNYIAQKTYGIQIIDSSSSIGSNLAKVMEKAVIPIGLDLPKYQEDHCMKLFIG